jgi:hypothetical protein
MPLSRILPRLNGTVPAQPAYAARAWPSLARLGLDQRSTRGPRSGPARPGVSVRAAAWHACAVAATSPAHGRRPGKSTAGPHRRVDGSAAELAGVDGVAQAAR